MNTQRTSSIVEGNWKQPKICLSNWGGFRYLPLKNRINLNAKEGTFDDILVAGLVHEINHWAQLSHLSKKAMDKALDAHDFWLGEYDDHPLEKAAWWGTGFIRRGVKENGNL